MLDDRSLKELIGLLRSPSESTRVIAARKLAQIGGQEAMAALSGLAQDRNPVLRFLAQRVAAAEGRSGSVLLPDTPQEPAHREDGDAARNVAPPPQTGAIGLPPAAGARESGTGGRGGVAGGGAATRSPSAAEVSGALRRKPPAAEHDASGNMRAATGGHARAGGAPEVSDELSGVNLSALPPEEIAAITGDRPGLAADPSRADDAPLDWVGLRRAAMWVLKPCVGQLVELLSGEDTEVAMEAAMALGRLRVTDALDPMLVLLRRGTDEERIIAAIGELGDSRGMEPLLRIYKDEKRKHLRPAVAKATIRLPGPASEEFLRRALMEADISIQILIVRHVAETHNERFLDLLLTKVGAVEDYFDIAVIQALGRFCAGSTRVASYLISRLAKEGNPRKSSCIVTALTRSKDPAVVDALERTVRARDRRVRANTVEAIARMEISAAVKQRILKPLLTDEDNRVRANVAKVLWRLGEKSAADVVRAMLSHKEKWWRASACHALGEVRPEGFLALLAKALRDADVDVRINATKALREVDDPAAGTLLVSLVQDRNLWIRLYAAETLGNMHLAGASEFVRNALRHEEHNQVIAALLVAAGKTAGKSVDATLPEVVRFLSHIEEKVQVAAIDACEHMNAAAAVPHLASLIRDPKRKVRSAAVRALWKLGQLRVVSTLFELLARGPFDDKIGAAASLGELGPLIHDLPAQAGAVRMVDALKALPVYARP